MEKFFIDNVSCHASWRSEEESSQFFRELCIGNIGIAGYFYPDPDKKVKKYNVIDFISFKRASVGTFLSEEEAEKACLEVAHKFVNNLKG